MAVPILRLNIDDNPRIIVKQDNMPVIVTGNTYWNFTGSGATTVVEDAHGNIVDVTIYSPIVDTSTFIGVDTFSAYTATTIADIQNAVDCCTGLTETFNTYTADTFNTLSGLTWAGIVLQAQVNGLENAFESHTGDTTIHFPFSDVTDAIASATSGITATSAWSGLTGYPTDNADLNAILTGMTADILANTQCCTGNTADIEYHYQQFTGFTDYFSTLIIPAITGNTQDISDLSGAFDSHSGNTLIHFEKTDISYNDLQDLPSLFSGDYDDLTNKPDLSIYLTGYTVTADDVTGITASLYAPIIHTHPYSGLTGLPTLFSGDYDDLTNKPDLSVYQPVSGMSAYLTGVTWNDVTNKPDLTLQSDFTGHTSDMSIHYPMSGISITESQISDLQAYALQSAINTYTGTTAPATYALKSLALTGATNMGTTSLIHGTPVSGNKLQLKGLAAASSKITVSNTTTNATVDLGSVALDDLSDVIITSAAANQVLQYSGTSWQNIAATDIFANVDDGELLARNGTSITGVTQTKFALSAHTHSQYLTGFTVTCDMVTGCTDGLYAAVVHTHVISGVTGLQTALDGKSDTGHTHTSLTGLTITESQVTNLVTDLAGKQSLYPTIKDVTGTTYTILTGDAGNVLEFSNTGATTVLFPTGLTTGLFVEMYNLGGQQITFSGDTGSTVNASGGNVVLSTLYGYAKARYRGNNNWIIFG